MTIVTTTTEGLIGVLIDEMVGPCRCIEESNAKVQVYSSYIANGANLDTMQINWPSLMALYECGGFADYYVDNHEDLDGVRFCDMRTLPEHNSGICLL